MNVLCVRIEMDTNLKRFVFAFVMTEASEGYYLPGELRITSEDMNAYTIGKTYRCSIN